MTIRRIRDRFRPTTPSLQISSAMAGATAHFPSMTTSELWSRLQSSSDPSNWQRTIDEQKASTPSESMLGQLLEIRNKAQEMQDNGILASINYNLDLIIKLLGEVPKPASLGKTFSVSSESATATKKLGAPRLKDRDSYEKDWRKKEADAFLEYLKPQENNVKLTQEQAAAKVGRPRRTLVRWVKEFSGQKVH